jgi:hypothetical protein
MKGMQKERKSVIASGKALKQALLFLKNLVEDSFM